MPPLLLALVGASAVAHATWNIALKGEVDPERGAMRAVIAPGLAVGLFTLATFLLGIVRLDALGLALGIAAGVAEVAYFVTLARAYRAAPISLVYPVVRGVNPLTAVLVGTLLLNEQLVGFQPYGVAALLVGLMILHRPWRALLPGDGNGSSRAPLSGAIAAGLLSAFGSSLERVGVTHLGALEFFGITWGITALLYLAIARAQRASATPTPRLLGVGTLMVGGHLLVLSAFAIAPLSVVVPLRESAVLLVSGWGLLRRREAANRSEAARRAIGALTIVGGAAFIALG